MIHSVRIYSVAGSRYAAVVHRGACVWATQGRDSIDLDDGWWAEYGSREDAVWAAIQYSFDQRGEAQVQASASCCHGRRT